MRFLAALLCVSFALPQSPQLAEAVIAATPGRRAPASEALEYKAEWRLIQAGIARLNWAASRAGNGWESSLNLESVGLVSRLYKVNNQYSSHLNDRMCIERSQLNTNEGSKKRETRVTFDSEQKKAKYVERDMVKNTVVDNHEIDIRPCEHDVIAALYQLRTMDIPLGQSVQLPISDGKKTVTARVDAQEREKIKVGNAEYNTIRYEAHLFNGVLYRRRGRLFVWLTDDDRRLPVQIRVRLPFYIGTVTLQLQQKEGKT